MKRIIPFRKLHNSAIHQIAVELQISEKEVDTTLRLFFGKAGLKMAASIRISLRLGPKVGLFRLTNMGKRFRKRRIIRTKEIKNEQWKRYMKKNPYIPKPKKKIDDSMIGLYNRLFIYKGKTAF